jgi:hypothetical protein
VNTLEWVLSLFVISYFVWNAVPYMCSVTFWYGSGSVYPYLWFTGPAPVPGLFFSGFQKIRLIRNLLINYPWRCF